MQLAGQNRLETVEPWMAELPELNDFQFAQWVELLERRAGVIVPEERRSFLVTGLKLRMQEIGCSSYQEYYDRLNAGSVWSVFG